MTTTTTPPPTAPEALVFYTAACPLVERLLAMARAWRDRAPADPEAITAHSEMTWLAIRCDLRLSRQRDLTADQTTGAGRPVAPPDRPGGPMRRLLSVAPPFDASGGTPGPPYHTMRGVGRD